MQMSGFKMSRTRFEAHSERAVAMAIRIHRALHFSKTSTERGETVLSVRNSVLSRSQTIIPTFITAPLPEVPYFSDLLYLIKRRLQLFAIVT